MGNQTTFDGLQGRAVARIMARSNRETELEAVEILDPSERDAVLAVGIGPGVGVWALAQRAGAVVGVDPSQAMIDASSRRCRKGIRRGVVQLHRTDAASIPVLDASMDGAVAVNSIQLWEPLDASLGEIARALRPGGRLVTLTHDWAIERSCGIDADAWVERTAALCLQYGLVDPETRRAKAERGKSVVLNVRRERS